MLMCSAAAL